MLSRSPPSTIIGNPASRNLTAETCQRPVLVQWPFSHVQEAFRCRIEVRFIAAATRLWGCLDETLMIMACSRPPGGFEGEPGDAREQVRTRERLPSSMYARTVLELWPHQSHQCWTGHRWGAARAAAQPGAGDGHCASGRTSANCMGTIRPGEANCRNRTETVMSRYAAFTRGECPPAATGLAMVHVPRAMATAPEPQAFQQQGG